MKSSEVSLQEVNAHLEIIHLSIKIFIILICNLYVIIITDIVWFLLVDETEHDADLDDEKTQTGQR